MNASIFHTGAEMHAKNEDRAVYGARGAARHGMQDNDAVIQHALSILEERTRRDGVVMSNPSDVKDYMALRMGALPHEVFVVLFLDAQNRMIAAEEMFRGTLTQTSVYPREVIKAALIHNAAAVIFGHNHPSGTTEPSHADRALTDQLKIALGYVDIKALDHIIVGGANTMSFAERGYL